MRRGEFPELEKIRPRSQQVLLPSHDRFDFSLTQVATDATLRPEAVGEYFSATGTSPFGEPPCAREVHPDPSQQDREIFEFAKLETGNHETQKQKAEKEHYDQIAPRYVAVPRSTVNFHILWAAFPGQLVRFSASVQLLRVFWQ
jgi:hypothetical protein